MKYSLIAILMLASTAFAQSAPGGSQCPITLKKASLGAGGSDLTMYLDMTNDSDKKIDAVKLQVQWFDATHDAKGSNVVVTEFKFKPHQHREVGIPLRRWVEYQNYATFSVMPERVAFTDGSVWTGQCGTVTSKF